MLWQSDVMVAFFPIPQHLGFEPRTDFLASAPSAPVGRARSTIESLYHGWVHEVKRPIVIRGHDRAAEAVRRGGGRRTASQRRMRLSGNHLGRSEDGDEPRATLKVSALQLWPIRFE